MAVSVSKRAVSDSFETQTGLWNYGNFERERELSLGNIMANIRPPS